MGQQHVQAATFDWKWYYSAARSLIWLALIVAILVPKANHNLRILWILVPLAIVNLAWLAFKRPVGMPSLVASQFDLMFQSMVVGTAVLWLTAGYLRKVGGFVRFLMCFGTFVAAACLAVVSYSVKFSREVPWFLTLLPLTLLPFLVLAMLGAITLSRRLSGGKYRPVRFILWLAPWTLLGGSIALGGSILVPALVWRGEARILDAMLMFAMGGPILGLCLYLLNLPFMILGFAHPFFRERLCACLGLQTVTSGPASQIQAGESSETMPLPERN